MGIDSYELPERLQKNRRGGRLCPPAENPVFTKIFGEFVTSHGRKPRPPLREGEIKPLTLCARGFCDRVYKPGSVIDSHLSRRIVANALQPPPRKQPGRPCFLHGVAPDRVYSNGRFHADACALTARFHPYLVGANFISFASPQAAKLIHSVAPTLPSKQGLCRLFFAQLGDIVFSRSTDIKDEAVYFCCTFPQIALGGRYPLSLPCGARTFLMIRPLGRTPRLSVPVALLFYLILGGMSNKLQFFSMADIMEIQSAKRGRYHEREGFCIF